jgi:hypothetical protein
MRTEINFMGKSNCEKNIVAVYERADKIRKILESSFFANFDAYFTKS